MNQFKSIIKTLGLWLVFVVSIIFSLGAMGMLTEKGGLGSVVGWVLTGITLSLLIFLFITKRRSFRIAIIILAAFWFIILLTRIATLNISENEFEFDGIAFWLLVMAIVYFLGAWLIMKSGVLKVIGVLLVLAVSFAGGLVSTAPDHSRLVMMLNRAVWILMAGMGIFMVTRKGIGLRLLGVGLIIATMLTVFMAVFSFSSSTVITGKDRMIILASVESRINDLFQAWNDKDYQIFSKNFSDEMKENLGQDEFLSVRDESGKLISTDELRKIAPKSDSPSVTIKASVINVMYGVTFEKDPINVYAFTFQFQKYDSTYLIRGVTFDVIGGTLIVNSGVTTYSVSISDSETKKIERYLCSSPKYDDNKAKALLPSALLQQKLDDEVAQLNNLAIQLNEMGSQNSTNNYNALADDYDTQKVTFETNKKQRDSEEQEYENYIKTNCENVGN